MYPRIAALVRDNRTMLLREAVLVGILLAAFVSMMFAVDHPDPTGFDRRIARTIQSISWGDLAFIPRIGSDIGGGVYGFYLLPAAATTGFVIFRRWRLLALLLAVFALHYLLISPKLLITAYRPSPLFGVEGAGGLESFPSGHVEWATSFYGFLAYLVWRAAPGRWRWWVPPLYAAVVIATMLGRIELGRHWPVDTVAGLIAGLIAFRLIVAADAFSVRGTRPVLDDA